MLEEEVPTCSQLLTHEFDTESDMRLCLFKLDRELLMPLGAINRFVKVLEITEFSARGNISPTGVLATGSMYVLVVVLVGR